MLAAIPAEIPGKPASELGFSSETLRKNVLDNGVSAVPASLTGIAGFFGASLDAY